MKRLLRYLLSFSIAILIVIGTRMFCVSSYRLSTDSMKNTLQRGDFVLVNKMKKNDNNPGRNRVVLFRSPLRKDMESPPLFLSRCVGMPGDTIRISHEGYQLNGKLLPNSPAKENSYRIRKNIIQPLRDVLHKLEIPYRNAAEDSLSLTIRLTPKEEIKLREHLPEILHIQLIPENQWSYTFVIPIKYHAYPMDSAALILYKEAILAEAGEKTSFLHNGKLIHNGKETEKFIFQQNYYWVLSDNEDEAIDSRHLGLIPESSIVGNVCFCWYSSNKNRIFRRID